MLLKVMVKKYQTQKPRPFCEYQYLNNPKMTCHGFKHMAINNT